MALQIPGSSKVQKLLPRATGVAGAAMIGIGSYKLARFVDSLIGNRIQAIGIDLPFAGRVSLLDAVLIPSFLATMHKKPSWVFAAIAADRVLNLAQNPSSLIPGISLGGNGTSGSGVASNVPAISSGGGI